MAAVEHLQQAAGLAVDGVVGPTTWAVLLRQAPVRQHPFPPTLQHDAEGPLVKALQQALNDGRARFAAGALPIHADGAYGPQTVERVKEFQQWGAVLVDGIVGYRTWSVPIGPSLWSL